MTLVLSAIGVNATDGKQPSAFRIEGGSCRVLLKLAPRAACTVTVSFTPTDRGKRGAAFSVSAFPPAGTSFAPSTVVLLTGRGGVPLPQDTPALTGVEPPVQEETPAVTEEDDQVVTE